MPRAERVVRISPRGQITLPRDIRERLHCDALRIVAEGDGIRLDPVWGLAGSLREYARDGVSPDEAREAAWVRGDENGGQPFKAPRG